MRAPGFRRLRLTLRDLAATSAFGAMAISGELPPWILLLFLGGLVVALLDLRPLARAPLLSGLALLAGALGLYANVAFGSVDLVVAACAFAALITLHRMLSPPTQRTDHQVLLTSVLMISGGAALSGELLFAVMLALFAALACPSLALAAVERTAEGVQPPSPAPVLRLTGVAVGFALIGTAVFFLLIPRVSWNVAHRRASRGLGATTGLADGIRLGEGSGTIKTNPRVIARVKLAPDPRSERLDAYWVASTLGVWTGTEWAEDRPAQRPRISIQVRPGAAAMVHQKIELLPSYGSQVVFALSAPALVGNAVAHDGGSHRRTGLVYRPGHEIRVEQPADAHSYHAYSVTQSEDDAPLLPEDERVRLTALPDDIDPRMTELAAKIVGPERDPLKAAHRIERHLEENFAYTLELPGVQSDPLSHFLFERRAGHCEYFATALAVLLRTQGIPARVATGFFGGERVGPGTYALRAGDAHAWTQVHVPGRGFVDLDATPPAGRGAQPPWVLEWIVGAYERVDSLWRDSVLSFSLMDQYAFAQSVVPSTRRERGPPLPDAKTAWMALAVLALGAYLVWRVRVRAAVRRPDIAAHLRGRAENLLESMGLRCDPGEGLEELTCRLEAESHPVADALAPVTRAWLEARYGRALLSASQAEALLRRLAHRVKELRADGRRRAA